MSKFRSAISGGAAGASAAQSTGGPADPRAAERHPLVRETAIIGYDGRKLEALLVNVSGGGAMIEADISPRMWDRVDLYLGEGTPIECAVRWLRGRRIGLEFAHETQIDCPPAERDALLREVIRRNFPETAAAPAASAPTFDASRRTARRHPLIWNGVIRWLDKARTVRLRNISASGVLVDSENDYPEGIELVLDLGKSGQYAVTVGWSRGGQTGLIFKTAFEMSALAAKRPQIAGQRWKRPAYLDRCSDLSSPWASEWQRSDLSALSSDLAG